MKLIRIDDLEPQPWKNGGGVTREIALCADDAGLIWRLSVADVERAGPFSIFPGLARILTVIEGAGLRLHCPGGLIEARPGVPVEFSGDTPIECSLVAGAVRDFNLIFDPKRIAISVARLDAGAQEAKGGLVGLLPLGAACEVEGLGVAPAGSFVQFDGDGAFGVSVGCAALLVRVDHAPERSEARALR